MITDFFLSLPAYLLQFIVGVLPAGQQVPTEWTSAVFKVWSYINSFSFIFPVDTLLWCLGIAMTFHLAIFTFHAVQWIIRHIPGIG